MKNTLLKSIIALFLTALFVSVLSGCQQVTAIEYYDVTEANQKFSVTQSEKNAYGHGPVKRIEGKSGLPDFSDNKTFSLRFSVL